MKQRCHLFLLTLWFGFCSLPLICLATVIEVPNDYSTIQQALDTAAEGDEIIVSPGTYVENINVGGKNITLRSTEPTNPTVVASTVIDGNQSGSVVTFAGTELTSCILSGFTITNGYAVNGGGVYGTGTLATIHYNRITSNTAYGRYSGRGLGGGLAWCHGMISDNTISGNTALEKGAGLYECNGTIQRNLICGNMAGQLVPWISAGGGGGAYCDGTIQENTISGNSATGVGGGLFGCDHLILNNVISGNSADWGGGLTTCDGTIHHNTISRNSAQDSGGGMDGCRGSICNNTISGNSAGWRGGGLYHCRALMQNNTIVENSAGSGGGGLSDCRGPMLNNTIAHNQAGEFGGGLHSCEDFISNCIFWGNSAAIGSQLNACSTPFYSCIQDWTGGGHGNFFSDPRFIDPFNEDYHLQPDSPCVDAGNTYYLFGDYLVDIDGECRIAGSSVDMGSDELGSSFDSDGDLLADIDEATYGSNLTIRDTDGDGLIDGAEVLRGTDPTIPNSPSGISIPAHYPSIQQGLFLAFPSEVITVSPGLYHENLHLLGKNLVLQSTDPLDEYIVKTTAIDGDGLFSVITFEGSENQTCVVRGLTIQHGTAYYGGGINGNETMANIEHNRIVGNWAFHGGGLYHCRGLIQDNLISGNAVLHSGGGLCACFGIIRHNVITDNSAGQTELLDGYGGGLYFCTGSIINNLISGNSSSWCGGGLYQCTCSIVNNVISLNSAWRGGGLAECKGTIDNNIIQGNLAQRRGGGLWYCSAYMDNNVIYGNSAEYGGGVDDSMLLTNCILWANTADYGPQAWGSGVMYCCIQDWTDPSSTIINSAPLFVDPDNGDFQLQDGSPCIDVGDPDPQYNDGCRPPGKGTERNDMGAYGGLLNCAWLIEPALVRHWDFQYYYDWQFETSSPGPFHYEHWADASLRFTQHYIGISSPYDESTNYFASWHTLDWDTIPYYDDALYQVDWYFSTDRESTNCTPSFRFRIGLNTQKAFAYSRLYSGDWLPLAQQPELTHYQLFFESPIAAPALSLAFSLIDWANDFRQSSPAGTIYLDEVVVYKYELDYFTSWQEEATFSNFDSWTNSGSPPYTSPDFTRSAEGLSLSSGISADRVFGSWDSPANLFTVEPSKLYRLTTNLSSNPQLGGPELRLRVHTDDFRYSWYTHYLSSYTAGESALPPEQGADFRLYLTLPFAPQPCRLSFDLIDFSSTTGGTLSLHHLSLHSHPF